MRNRRYTHPDRPAARSPYETLTVGGLVASLLVIPLVVAVLAVPVLVIATAAGAASVPLFEKATTLAERFRSTRVAGATDEASTT